MRAQAKSEWPLKIRIGSVTVKVYQTPTRGNPGYTLAYHEGARRVRRMFGDLGDAKREGRIAAEKLNAGRGDALKLTGSDRDAYLHAVEKLKPLKIGLVPAIDEYAAAKKWDVPLTDAARAYHELHNSKLPDKSVHDVYLGMLEAKKRDGASQPYLHDLRSRLGHFARDFHGKIAEVTTADIDAWLRALKLSPRSRNNHRNAVAALFNFAQAAGYLNRDRTTAAKHAARAREKKKPIDFFSPDEFSKLLTAADSVILPLFVLGGFCGLRTVEISRLRWEDIRWAESSIIISEETSKGGPARRRRIAPLTAPASAWLAAWMDAKGRVIGLDQPDQRVRGICEATGLLWRRNALRHSFITYRVATTKDFVKTAYEAGNAPGVIQTNYDAVATEREGKAWFAIMPMAPANVVPMKTTA